MPEKSQKNDSFALASLVLGVLSILQIKFLWASVILGLLAVVFGIFFRFNSKNDTSIWAGVSLAGILTGIIGILFPLVSLGANIQIAAENYNNAKIQRTLSDINSINMSLHTYELLNHAMPSTEQGLKALVSQPSTEPRPRRWKQLMKEVPLDPWGSEYVYRNPGKGGSGFDLYSLGPDGKESDDDSGKN